MKLASPALTGADWPHAFALFREAATKDPSRAETWAGLAKAAYWVPDDEAVLEARERAYHLHRERGDSSKAAQMAAWLAVDWIELRGQIGLANGWIQRAKRLLGRSRETPESAWITTLHTRFLMITGTEAGTVRRMASRAAALARRFGLSDVEALALGADGHALLSMGDIETPSSAWTNRRLSF